MRNYKRKTTRGSTPRDVLQRAAVEIDTQFNVNRMTLKRYITKDAVTGYQAIATNKAMAWYPVTAP